MAGGNKNNSAKVKKRKLQVQLKARNDAARRKNRRPNQGGSPRFDSNV